MPFVLNKYKTLGLNNVLIRLSYLKVIVIYAAANIKYKLIAHYIV
jgi:hypothetical protein